MALEFDEQDNLSNNRVLNKEKQPHSIIAFLIKHHIIKNEKVARITLLVLAILIFAISFYFIFNSLKGPVFIV